uniref:Endo/exonuclease/phosphatase domain-containing protein n=1 Tax=Heligmosomoides polygyrus TaxID=6339 RepID=A0A183GW68_HELPZ
LEKLYKEDHIFYKVVVGDFNVKIGPPTSPEELHIGTHGLEWNEQGERLSWYASVEQHERQATDVRACKAMQSGDIGGS